MAGMRETTYPRRGDHPRRAGPSTSTRPATCCPTTAPSTTPSEVDEPLRENRDFLDRSSSARASRASATRSRAPRCRCSCSSLTGSGFVMGIVNVLTTLPDLLVGLFAGAYADRWDRRRMMFAADLGRARPDRRRPDLRLARRPDDRGHPPRDLPDAGPARPVARGVHGVGPGARRAVAGRPGERDLRGGVQRRLDHRPGDRRPPRGDDRPRRDDRDRRAHVPRVRRSRSCSCAGRSARSGSRRRTSSRTSARGSGSSPTSRRCAPSSPCGPRPRSSPRA